MRAASQRSMPTPKPRIASCDSAVVHVVLAVEDSSAREPLLLDGTSSSSGKFPKCSCFRFLVTTCRYWSTRVHWCPALSAAIVIQLGTRL
jgi:hypothetical protein